MIEYDTTIYRTLGTLHTDVLPGHFGVCADWPAARIVVPCRDLECSLNQRSSSLRLIVTGLGDQAGIACSQRKCREVFGKSHER